MAARVSRRDFLAAFGLSFLSDIAFNRLAEAADKDASLFASAFMDKDGRFGTAILDQDGNILSTYPLPGRGHGMAAATASTWLVTFARRPGNFALAIDISKRHDPVFFKSPPHTHFYGHGVFSRDGRLLFATENRFESGRGLIGIYDATDGYGRIGEISSHGIGPHEIAMMPDGHTLCIANGGILTHPDTGRAKLNLHEMQSSIAFMDSRHGDVIARFDVPESIRRLSLRHMAVDHKMTVWLGGQYEGDESELAPLIATADMETGLEFPNIAPIRELGLANYVGSVARHGDGRKIAFSSPRSGRLIVVDADKGIISKAGMIPNVCGVAASKDGFFATSHSGEANQRKTAVHWDNHVVNA